MQLLLNGRPIDVLGELNSGANAKIIAGVSSKAWRRDGGFASEAWTDLGFATAWDATQRRSDREDGAFTLFLGGGEVRATEDGNAQAQGRKLVERLDRIMPGVAGAATGRYVRTRWHADRFSNGSYVTFKPGQYTRFGEFLWIEAETAEDSQEVRAGNLVFAGEHLSDALGIHERWRRNRPSGSRGCRTAGGRRKAWQHGGISRVIVVCRWRQAINCAPRYGGS